jgi:hypothetical protein
VSDPRRFTAQTKLAQHERRVTNLERRMLDFGDDPDEPGCCELYCVFASPGSTITSFNIGTPLSLSLPHATSCRFEIDWCISYSQSSSGNFAFQPQLVVAGTVRRPIMPFSDTGRGAGDMQPVAGCDVVDVLGGSGDITVDLQVFNTGANTITLQDGMMKIRKQGRHGSISCNPGTVGQ